MDTNSILKITKGNNSAKNVGGVTVVNLCIVWSFFIFLPSFLTSSQTDRRTDGQTDGTTLKSSEGIT